MYNNSGGGTVTHTRTTDSSNPLGGNVIKITTNGTASPGAGGYYLYPASSSTNSTYYQVIVAKIPTGYKLTPAYNSLMGGSYQWLTSNAGTGNYETYVLKITTGSDTSEMSWGYVPGKTTDFGFMYISGSNNTSVTWYLAYAQTFNATKAESTYKHGTTGIYKFPAQNQTLTANWRKWITQYRCRYWGSWSSWQDSAVSSSSTRQVNTRTVYRNFGSWEGWNWDSTAYYGSASIQSRTVYRNWGSWSGWSTTKYTSSSTRQVESKLISQGYWSAWGALTRDYTQAYVSRNLWGDGVPVDANRYKWVQYGGQLKSTSSGNITAETVFIRGQDDTSIWLFGSNGRVSWLTGVWGLGDMGYGNAWVRYMSTNVYSRAWGDYNARSWVDTSYYQYRYRDLGAWTTTAGTVGQTGTQYNHRTPGDWTTTKGSAVYTQKTQYQYRDAGSWTSWGTTDCTSGYAGRETRYGDYGS